MSDASEGLSRQIFDSVFEEMIHENVITPFKAMTGVFNATSIEEWIELANASGVPAIPAEVVLKIPVDVLRRVEEPRKGDEVHAAALKKAMDAVPDGFMLRWDCCAAESLKAGMHEGAISIASMKALTPFDMRFQSILFEYPNEVISVVQRPWVDARKVESHPVEYRVFVENDTVIGVSNYYVQRGLALNDAVQHEIETCIQFSKQIIKTAKLRNTMPWLGPYAKANLDPSQMACSLDFLVTQSGEVQFIEAGPAFRAGAHPCCFDAHKVDGKYTVHGVALSRTEPVLPLSLFLNPTKAPKLAVIVPNEKEQMIPRSRIPSWLEAIMNDTERAIIQHPSVEYLMDDEEGNPLPHRNFWIRSPLGSMFLDTNKKVIVVNKNGPGELSHLNDVIAYLDENIKLFETNRYSQTISCDRNNAFGRAFSLCHAIKSELELGNTFIDLRIGSDDGDGYSYDDKLQRGALLEMVKIFEFLESKMVTVLHEHCDDEFIIAKLTKEKEPGLPLGGKDDAAKIVEVDATIRQRISP